MNLTDQQITDIAREYAEEMCAHMEDDFIKDEAIRDNELTFQMAVNHLSQRYCLVEKSKLKAIRFRKVYSEEDIRSKFTEECLIDALFPEIAKEVEG